MSSAALDGQMIADAAWHHPDPTRDAEIKADLARIRARRAADPSIETRYCRTLLDYAIRKARNDVTTQAPASHAA